MKQKKCSLKKTCLDYGNCEGCVIGEQIGKYEKKIARLEKEVQGLREQKSSAGALERALIRKKEERGGYNETDI